MARLLAIRGTVWLIVAALCAQAWIGQLATAAAATAADALVICTGTGFKVISLPNDEGPLPPPSSRDEDDHEKPGLNCTACLAQATAQGIPVSTVSITLWRWTERLDNPCSEQPLAVKPAPRSPPSRAPPPQM